MATTHHHSRDTESVADYNRSIAKHMPLATWKPLKSAFYAVLITGLAIFAIYANADPTTVFLAAVSTIIVVTSVEVKEVQVARAVSIRFFHGDAPREEDQER